ncbi:hypothetical protein Y1Q_0020635 [Alligator mississippiensis]|uniref:Uncharacterized protein n=1 Tax=Alligator mississippiensis TaxID=8496 RepID=A0A151NH71_ALLMI|nr:hypothetical protein Y1Q_0020635 [Alligator mississippiensis]
MRRIKKLFLIFVLKLIRPVATSLSRRKLKESMVTTSTVILQRGGEVWSPRMKGAHGENTGQELENMDEHRHKQLLKCLSQSDIVS